MTDGDTFAIGVPFIYMLVISLAIFVADLVSHNG